MISLELARQLKESGLEWEPKTQDVFYFNKLMEWHPSFIRGNLDIEAAQYENWLFAPTLSQLLAEIEKRWKWLWQMGKNEYGVYTFTLIDGGYNARTFEMDKAKEPEAAAAAALIWLLREGE